MIVFSTSALSDRYVLNGLKFLWILIVFWGELGIFFWSVSSCNWPDLNIIPVRSQEKAAHILIIADPQILDHHSYPGRSRWLTTLSKFVVDLNMGKSWQAVRRRFDPDEIVFLGDMQDGGRSVMSDDEYEAYYSRFRKMFQSSAPAHFLPGNHDIGLGISPFFSDKARDRYTSHYGPLNQHFTINNHTILLLDAPSIVEEDYQRESSGMSYDQWKPRHGGPIAFVEDFASNNHLNPVTLFTHIPLFRPEGASCGLLREKGTIHRGVGHGYQNTLGKQTSQFLLDKIRPSAVFSGDDHDYCEYVHTSPHSSVKEVTVKSFSMAMGVKKPGFQLLSLSGTTHADSPCLLPDQISIYLLTYLPLFIISLVLVALLNLLPDHRSRVRSPAPIHTENTWLAYSPVRSHTRVGFDSESDTESYDMLEDFGGGSPRSLPAPGSANLSRRHHSISGVRTFLNNAQRLKELLPVCRRRANHGRRRQGFWGRFLGDMLEVAIPPLSLFVFITWWTFLR